MARLAGHFSLPRRSRASYLAMYARKIFARTEVAAMHPVKIGRARTHAGSWLRTQQRRERKV